MKAVLHYHLWDFLCYQQNLLDFQVVWLRDVLPKLADSAGLQHPSNIPEEGQNHGGCWNEDWADGGQLPDETSEQSFFPGSSVPSHE